MAEFFESVGAPLNNVRWSWGARRSSDGAIFLRVWKDQSHTDADGRHWVQIVWHSASPDWEPGRHGRHERQAHLKAIESGARCLMVVCEVEDASANPRTVRAFDHRTVLVGGELKR